MSENDPILAALVRLEAGQKSMRAEITNLRVDVTSLRANVMEEICGMRAVLIERMDRLQGRLDQLHEQCFIAFAQGRNGAVSL
jgi:1,6-anhydro-N-acetylmuramate kinase